MADPEPVIVYSAMTEDVRSALRRNVAMERALSELHAQTKDLLSAFRAPIRRRRST
jgi:hypothetical protein